MSTIKDGVEIYEESNGLIKSGKFVAENITTAGRFINGADMLGSDGKTYHNSGTTALPVWQDVDSISTSELATGAVTLAKLATGIIPSHIVKFFKLGSTITTTTLTGLAVGDFVISLKADGTVTVEVCATINTLPSDPADDTYVLVLRVAA